MRLFARAQFVQLRLKCRPVRDLRRGGFTFGYVHLSLHIL